MTDWAESFETASMTHVSPAFPQAMHTLSVSISTMCGMVRI